MPLLLGVHDCDPKIDFLGDWMIWVREHPMGEDIEEWAESRDRHFQDKIREHFKPVIEEMGRLNSLCSV